MKKRNLILSRVFNISELNIPEEVLAKYKPINMLLHTRKKDFELKITELLKVYRRSAHSINSLEKLGDNDYTFDKKSTDIVFQIVGFVIQYFNIYENCLNNLLYFHLAYDKENGKEFSTIRSDIEKEIKQYIKCAGKNAEYDRLVEEFDKYRFIRNQFTHFPIGMLTTTNKNEKYENFLRKKVAGILLLEHESLHCIVDGKPGFVTPYRFENDDIVYNLIEVGEKLHHWLADYLLGNE